MSYYSKYSRFNPITHEGKKVPRKFDASTIDTVIAVVAILLIPVMLAG